MNLTLYYNASERKVVGKNITARGSVTGVFKGDASVLRPVFVLDSNSLYLTNVNYLYCSETGRYYYIDDIELTIGGRMVLYCSVDVLQTYKTQIKNQTAIIKKQQNTNQSNIYFNDGSFVTDARDFYTVKTFSNGFNDNGEFILITAGA